MKKTILLIAAFVFLTIQNHAQTVTDIDGNVYNTVTIGTQVWMKENLKVTHYRNGNVIPNFADTSVWNHLTTGARCYYNNDSVANSTEYGALYNWYAVVDSRKLCPAGCHVPSDGEWNIMEIYLDSTVDTTAMGFVGTDIGGKLKEAGTTHWNIINTGATNSSGFTALPGGIRFVDGLFYNIGYYGYWWATTPFNSIYAWDRALYYNDSLVARYVDDKVDGFSVRCVCDSLITQVKENSIDKRIHIYPNPASDKVYIDCAENQNFNIQVYSMIGDCVYSGILTRRTNEIDISSLSTGIYIIRLTGADGAIQEKLIKY